jgi:hypothetical protein
MKYLGDDDFAETYYEDEQGKLQPMYELSRRAALFVMPFVGGRKSKEGQLKLVDAFEQKERELNEFKKGVFVGHFLLDYNNGRDRLISERFMQLYCDMYGIKWDKSKGCPVAVCGFLNKTLYSLFPADVRYELKQKRNDLGDKYYQWLDEKLLEHIEEKVLWKIEGMLESAAAKKNKEVFWDGWKRAFFYGDQLAFQLHPKKKLPN